MCNPEVSLRYGLAGPQPAPPPPRRCRWTLVLPSPSALAPRLAMMAVAPLPAALYSFVRVEVGWCVSKLLSQSCLGPFGPQPSFGGPQRVQQKGKREEHGTIIQLQGDIRREVAEFLIDATAIVTKEQVMIHGS